MPLILQYRIHRQDLRANPDVLYVFGDNSRRIGNGGQAGEMRGEPNAVGIATLYGPGSYFVEDPQAVIAQNRILDEDFKRPTEHVKKGGILVWPFDGIGTGLAQLQRYSPTSFEYLEQKFIALCQTARLFGPQP